MTTYDFLTLAGKVVIRQGGVVGTRRMLVELDVQPNQRILELGAGQGATAFTLVERDPTVQVTGVDLSALMIDKARERAEELGVGERITFIQTRDPNVLPFDDDTFDAVIVESVAMYNDVEPFFREVLRVLKPGGRMALHDWTWAEEPSAAVEHGMCVVACGCDPGSVKFFSQAEWERTMTRQGFRIVFAEEYPFSFFSLSGMLDDEGTWGLLKMFGRVMSRKAAMRRMFSMMAFLARHESKFGYTIAVAEKPPRAAVAAGAGELDPARPSGDRAETGQA